MEKTVFDLRIHKNDTNNDAVIRMVGNHNAGFAAINFDLIEAHIKAVVAQYPMADKGTCAIRENNVLHLSRDGGETLTLSISEKEIYESNELNEAIFAQISYD